MVVPDVPLVLLLLLLLLWMDEEDPVFDVGDAFGGGGIWAVAVADFNTEGALLLVVGAADIDAIWNNGLLRCCCVM